MELSRMDLSSITTQTATREVVVEREMRGSAVCFGGLISNFGLVIYSEKVDFVANVRS